VAAVPNYFLKINPLTVVLAKPSTTSGLGLADVGVLVFVLGALFVVGVCVVGLLFVFVGGCGAFGVVFVWLVVGFVCVCVFAWFLSCVFA
jgi:hypothetical protein